MLQLLAALPLLASAVVAQSGGFGRFPCGTGAPNQALCTNANMQAAVAGCLPVAGQPVDGGVKSNGAIPTSAVCTLDVRGGLYFCGIAGSPCASDSNCDNGHCVAGTCTGGYTTPCTLDSQCTGNLYCLNAENPIAPNTAGTCGGSGADGTSAGALCADGCNYGGFLCASGNCNADTGTCVGPALAGPSQRARRSIATTRCPGTQQACSLPGSLTASFECVDVATNLEQCGGCAADGGVDCTAIPGVESVGCVDGVCEIWSCAEGFSWDGKTAECVQKRE